MRRRVEPGEQAAADVGPNDHAECHGQADQACAGQCRREQYGSQAGVGEQREDCAHDHGEQGIASQGGEQYAHAARLGDGLGGGDDQLQRQDNQAETDQHTSQLPGTSLLARQEQADPDQREQRRQP